MYKPFDEMPPFARLWVYPANRKLTPSEKERVEQGLSMLCDQWAAHGTPLKTSFTIQLDQFILLAVDERDAGASGCSIDGSVRLLKKLQEELGLDFFDRQKVPFLIDGTVILHSSSELKSLFECNALSGESITFDNTLATKAEWASHWKIPAKDTWLARYLPKPAGANRQP